MHVFLNTHAKINSSTWSLLEPEQNATSFFKKSQKYFSLFTSSNVCFPHPHPPINICIQVFFLTQHLGFTAKFIQDVLKSGKHGSYHQFIH